MRNQGLAACAAGMIFLCASTAFGGLGRPTVKNLDGVPTLSGGVGEDERKAIEAIDDHFNLKLVFSLDSGLLVSDVAVTLSDAEGRVLVDTTTSGPWFYAQVPKGEYTIVASKDGKALEQRVKVGWGRLTTVKFDDWSERDLRAASL
jgi:hypothetical protein